MNRNRYDDDIPQPSLRPMYAILIACALGMATLLAYCTAHAESLALIHTGCTAGATVDKCTGTKYDVPKATDLVRECASVANCWANGTPIARVFSALAPSAIIDACDTPNVPRGTVSPVPFTANDPCKHWQPVAVSSFVTTSLTGTLDVSWPAPPGGTGVDGAFAKPTDIVGYKLYSAVKGGVLGFIRQVPATPLTATLTGFANGTYTIGVTAVYKSGTTPAIQPLESAMSPTRDVEVAIPAQAVPAVPGAPGQPSITSVRFEF